jgi:hypothetical protein
MKLTPAQDKARAREVAKAHQAAELAHREAAATHKAAGSPRDRAGVDVGAYNERQAEQHKKEAKQTLAQSKKRHDDSGTVEHAKGVDDYEHSGDTEHEAEWLRHSGANVTRTKDYPGSYDDGPEGGGVVHYTLPKGVSHAQYEHVKDAQYIAQDGHRYPEVGKHYDNARYAVRAGKGDEAVKHAQEAHKAMEKAKRAEEVARNKAILRG